MKQLIFIGSPLIFVLCVSIAVAFVVVGFFEDNRWAADVLGISVVVSIVAALGAFVVAMWLLALRLHYRVRLIQPDENGDLPIIQRGNLFVNPNLLTVGAFTLDGRNGYISQSDPDRQAHAAWRLTTGKFGSVPRDILQQHDEQPLMLPQPSTRLLQPGESAPPVMIEARSIAQRM
jgi:hypothetical protein